MKKVSLFLLFFILIPNLIFAEDYFWEPINSSQKSSSQKLLYKKSSDKMFAASHGSGVLYWNYAEETWEAKNNGLENLLLKDIKLGADGSIYVATNGDGIYVSSDDAENWSSLNENLDNLNINDLAILDDVILAGAWFNGGVYKSSDKGVNWTRVGLDDKDVQVVYIVDENTYLACSKNFGVYRSTNAGQSWSKVGFFDSATDYFEIRKSEDNNLYMTTTYGLYVSADQGMNWSPIAYKNQGIPCLDIYFKDGVTYLSTFEHGLLRSFNGGTDWVKINSGLGADKLVYSMSHFPGYYMYIATAQNIYSSVGNYTVTHLVLDIKPTEKQYKKRGEDINFSITLRDNYNNELEGQEITINNDYISETKLITDEEGKVEFSATIDDEHPTGETDIMFSAVVPALNQDTDETSSYEIYIQADFSMLVLPSEKQEIEWNQEFEYLVRTFWGTNPAADVKVEVENTMFEKKDTITSSEEGVALYKFTVPNEQEEKEYVVHFKVIDEEFEVLDRYFDVVDAISVNEIPGLDISIYPQPSNSYEKIFVRMNSDDVKELKLMDQLGNTVFSKIGTDRIFEIDCTKLASAVYFLNITIDNKTVLRKVIVN